MHCLRAVDDGQYRAVWAALPAPTYPRNTIVLEMGTRVRAVAVAATERALIQPVIRSTRRPRVCRLYWPVADHR